LELVGLWWQRIEHAFLAIAVIGAVAWLRRERTKLDISINTLSQQIGALEDAIEEGADQPEPAAAPKHWEQIRRMWADMRERMEYAIEERIRDGRRRRKYSNLQRHSYEDIINNLQRDLGLSSDAAEALRRMNAGFLNLRRSKAATEDHAKWFWAYYQLADKMLPKIPGDPD
jgi:hypothetical protein